MRIALISFVFVLSTQVYSMTDYSEIVENLNIQVSEEYGTYILEKDFKGRDVMKTSKVTSAYDFFRFYDNCHVGIQNEEGTDVFKVEIQDLKTVDHDQNIGYYHLLSKTRHGYNFLVFQYGLHYARSGDSFRPSLSIAQVFAPNRGKEWDNPYDLLIERYDDNSSVGDDDDYNIKFFEEESINSKNAISLQSPMTENDNLYLTSVCYRKE